MEDGSEKYSRYQLWIPRKYRGGLKGFVSAGEILECYKYHQKTHPNARWVEALRELGVKTSKDLCGLYCPQTKSKNENLQRRRSNEEEQLRRQRKEY